MRAYLRLGFKLALAYLIFSVLWILLSDALLVLLFDDPLQLERLQTSKGLLFVALSALLLATVTIRLGEKLEDSEERERDARQVQALLERHAGIGSWRHDEHLFHWSPQAAALLRLPPSSTLEELLVQISVTERGNLQRALVACLDQQQDAFSLMLRLNLPPDESGLHWLQFCAERDDQGRLCGSLRDVTEQHTSHEALRESEQRFRRLLEQTPRVAVQAYDRERRVIFWNGSSERLYGYSMTEALGKRLEELIIPEPMCAKVVGEIQRWMDGGPAIPSSELALKRKDGSLVWVYSSHLMLRNRHNQPEMYCLDIDLSELKQASLDLHNSERRLRQLVEQLGEAIFLCDERHYLRFVNPAWQRLTGRDEGHSLGLPLWQFFCTEDGELVRERADAILSGQEQHWSHELRLRGDQEQPHWVRLEIARDELDGGLRGSLVDTQLQHVNQQLQEARNATLDALLAQRPLADILLDITQRLEQINPRMRTSIMLVGDEDRLHSLAAPSLPAEYLAAIEGIEALPGVGSCGHAVATGELTIAADLQQHPNWADYRELVARFDLRACWSLPFKDERGRVLGTFGVYYDQPMQPNAGDVRLVAEFTRLIVLAIEQSRREHQREDSEQRFRATFEQAASGISLVSLEGRFLRVNQHLCRMLGYSEAELLRLSFQDITHPDDLDNDLTQVRRLRDGEIPRYSLDKRYRHRDGHFLWGRLDVALYRDADGTPRFFISSVQDISWRKQQERELQLAASVFQHSHEAMVVLDARWRVVAVNPAFVQLSGLTDARLRGRRLPPPDRRQTGRAHLRQLWQRLREQDQWSGEMLALLGAQERPLWVSASRVQAPDDPPEEVLYILLFNALPSDVRSSPGGLRP